jgi:hypothetical protein
MKFPSFQPRTHRHSTLVLTLVSLTMISSSHGEITMESQAPGTRLAAHAALVASAQSLDQRAEQSRSVRKYSDAIRLWRQSLQTAPTQSVWLKEYFWSRVAGPAVAAFPSPPQASGHETVESAVATLKPGRFWNPSLSETPNLTGTDRPEVFWLSLLEALRTRRETEAFEMLRRDAGRHSAMAPDVARALWRVLSFRQKHTLDTASIRVASDDDEHRFFQDLEKAAMAERDGVKGAVPAELASVLKSDEAISAVFVAGGWTRAGMELKGRAGELPSWLGFAKTQMARFTR